jgi:hypothetical protein
MAQEKVGVKCPYCKKTKMFAGIEKIKWAGGVYKQKVLTCSFCRETITSLEDYENVIKKIMKK